MLAADDLDIRGRIYCLGLSHRGFELTIGSHLGSEPILAAECCGQRVIVPWRQIVVAPVRVFLQDALDRIAFVVEDEDHRLDAVSSVVTDRVGGKLVRTLTGNQHGATRPVSNRRSQGGACSPANRTPQCLVVENRTVRQEQSANAGAAGSRLSHDDVIGLEKSLITRVERFRRDRIILPANHLGLRWSLEFHVCELLYLTGEFHEHIAHADITVDAAVNLSVVDTDRDHLSGINVVRKCGRRDIGEQDSASVDYDITLFYCREDVGGREAPGVTSDILRMPFRERRFIHRSGGEGQTAGLDELRQLSLESETRHGEGG